MSTAKEAKTTESPRRRLNCMPCFDALWFCYSPVHQLQQYYRLGVLDNCSAKWSKLYDCLSLKTKSSSELQVCP
ncbi:Early meiotic induction protein 1 [Bienertia sinuspersici]